MDIRRPDLLVIAHAANRRVNRWVYRELRRRGLHIVLLVPAEIPLDVGVFKPEPQEQDDPEIVQLHMTGYSTRRWSYKGIIKLLDDRQPRAVLLDLEPDSKLAFQIGPWATRNGAQFYVQACETMDASILAPLKSGRWKLALRNGWLRISNMRARPHITGIFAISKPVEECMKRRGYDGRTVIAPIGVEASMFHPDAASRTRVRTELGLNKPVIAYFGRIMMEKGVALLVKALHLLRDRDWQFLCEEPGSSSFGRELSTLVEKLGLRDRTIFFHASHDEMPAFINAADMVAVPSITTPDFEEQFGRVVSESMACGKAVVVSTSGALPWVLGGAGAVVPMRDVSSLADALAMLMDHPDYAAKLGALATKNVRERLSITCQADIMMKQFATTGLFVGKPAML